MLIDAYGLLPWSRTAAYQPRTHYNSRTNLLLLHLFFVFSSLILIFPVMVHSIEPVPSALWSLSVDPSYLPPSTSRNIFGADYGSDSETVITSTTPASNFWSAGRKSHKRHNISALGVPSQTAKRRPNQFGSEIDSGIEISKISPTVDMQRNDDDDIEEIDLQPSAAVVRWYRLYNRCSGGYLQIYMNDINARGKYASPLAQLRVETDSYGSRIRIQSQKFNKYLCFNRRQRITVKYNGRSERCVFVEKISDNHYTELESAWRPGLYLGFNRGDGKFLDPSRYYTDRRTCFQFIKNSNISIVDAFNTETYGQQQQVSGPSDFARLSPERQRWIRAKMHQDAVDKEVDEADDIWSYDNGHKHHRLRHERARLRHQRRHKVDDRQ